MDATTHFRLPDRLAWLAAGLAAMASAAGLAISGLYRDNDAAIAQARGHRSRDAVRSGSARCVRPVVRTRRVAPRSAGRVRRDRLPRLRYAIYSFQVVISPVTPIHIAILGLAAWSLILGGFALSRTDFERIGERLPRRTTAGFLGLDRGDVRGPLAEPDRRIDRQRQPAGRGLRPRVADQRRLHPRPRLRPATARHDRDPARPAGAPWRRRGFGEPRVHRPHGPQHPRALCDAGG